MAQHFLLTAAARTLTLASVARMSDEEAERVFIRLRWADNDGNAFCPHCGCTIVYMARRPNGAPRWRCKACRKDFSVTSGTLFAFHKMPLRSYLMAIAIFMNEVKGKSMLALSRDLGTQYKTAFVLAHKIREALASEVRHTAIGGAGKRVEVDGGYFGGYVKPANRRENRKDRRLRVNMSGKRKVVVVIRERNGGTLPGVFRTEADALSFISRSVPANTELYADEAGSWNELHARYTLHRITIRKPIHSADPTKSTRTKLRAFSAACAGPKSGTITIWPARTSSASHKRRHGARIIGGSQTGRRLIASSRSPCGTSRASISAATGSGARRLS
jgi:transposase-like protein